MPHREKAGVEPAERGGLFTPALGRKPSALFTRTSMSALTDFALLVFLFIKTGGKKFLCIV